MTKMSKTSLYQRWKNHPFSPGFTIVEILLYLGLFSIFIVILTNIYLTTLEAQSQAYANSVVQQSGQYLLTRLAYDVERADSLIIPSAAGQTGHVLQLTINGQSYTYQVTNQQFELINNSGTFVLNHSATQVTTFDVTRLNNTNGIPTIQIRLTLESGQPSTNQGESQTWQTTLGLRF